MDRTNQGSQAIALGLGITLALALALVIPAVAAQRGEGCCSSMGGQMADMQLIHRLLANRDHIKRDVTMRSDGVETLTEADDPDLARTIQAHVNAMYSRVTEGRPIHQRDPLFRELFKYAAGIKFSHEVTPNGVKVIETSTNPYVVSLIQAHASVVSLFIKNGHIEMMRNHTP
jgi:hypothetical protein